MIELSRDRRFLLDHDFLNLFDHFPGKGDTNHPRGDAWPVAQARERAVEMAPLLRGRVVVLFGENVAKAFGLRLPWLVWTRSKDLDATVAAVPHPSQVSRWWDNEDNYRRATRFFRALRKGTPWKLV